MMKNKRKEIVKDEKLDALRTERQKKVRHEKGNEHYSRTNKYKLNKYRQLRLSTITTRDKQLRRTNNQPQLIPRTNKLNQIIIYH